MSNLKRNMLYGGAVFILLLSVVTFVAIPSAGNSVAKQNTITFGKWDGTPIEYVQDSYFIRQIQSISDQMKAQGQEINQYSYYSVMQSAFNSAVVRLAILEELKIAGYKVPQSAVDKALIPYYLDSNGRYSTKLYNETAETTRASRRATLTEDLTAQRYIDDVFGDANANYGLKTAPGETDLIKKMYGPDRIFNFVSFSTAAYPDAETAAWGKEHADLFVKHDLSVITVETEAAAKKVAASLSKNEVSFEDAVTTYSTRVGTDAAGKLTKSFRVDLNKLFADAKDLDAVLALAPGAVSGIVKADKNWAIVRCDSEAKAADFADPTVIAAAASYINENERGRVEDYFVAKAKEFTAMADKDGLDAACKAFGVEKKTTTPFGINYGDVNILSAVPVDTYTELSGAQTNETFFKTAFSLAPNAVSEPILLGSNVVVLQLAEEQAADPQLVDMIPAYYDYVSRSWASDAITASFLRSDKLENTFLATYLKYFLN